MIESVFVQKVQRVSGLDELISCVVLGQNVVWCFPYVVASISSGLVAIIFHFWKVAILNIPGLPVVSWSRAPLA